MQSVQAPNLEQRAQELQDPKITQSTHHRNLAIEQAAISPLRENERKLEDSAVAARRSSVLTVEQGVPKVTPVRECTSPAPSSVRSKRQMTPQEFLGKIQEFVRNAEMNVQTGQPIWPAVVPSEHSGSRPESRGATLPKTVSAPSSIIWPAVVDPPEEPPVPAPTVRQELGQPAPPAIKLDYQPTSQKTAKPPPPVVKVEAQNTSLAPPDAPPRQKSPGRGYGPKPREHSPFLSEGASYFQSALSNPISKLPAEEEDLSKERRPSRIGPSPGKSYLDNPSTSPDPFAARSFEMDSPPSVNEAAATTSSIIRDLKRQAQNQQKFPKPHEVDEVITLDLRDNQEKLEYLSVPSDYSHNGQSTTQGIIPADAHIPMHLTPDPLMAHEYVPPPILQPVALQPASYGYGTQETPTLQDTDLYKKLKVGLDRLMETDKFKSLASSRTELNYSHSLGRAEFGDLRKRTTSFQGINTNQMASGAGRGAGYGQSQSRDSSNERPASAMAKISGGPSGSRQLSSQHGSRDNSLGRHESRQDY